MSDLEAPRDGDEWLGLTSHALPVAAAMDWASIPRCGAVVVFTGTVRDHADGRDGVTHLEYEAYDEQVVPKLRDIAIEVRRQWPSIGRVALLHRVGVVALGDPSVAVVASAPHRPEAFDAARFAIDTLKASVPIWKREFWAEGEAWGQNAQAVRAAGDRTSAHVESRG